MPLGAGEVELVLRRPRQQLLEPDAPLGLRHVDPETRVRTVPEAQRARGPSLQVEAIRIVELTLVAIRRRVEEDHLPSGVQRLVV